MVLARTNTAMKRIAIVGAWVEGHTLTFTSTALKP